MPPPTKFDRYTAPVLDQPERGGVVDLGMTLPYPRRRRRLVRDPETPIFNALAAEWAAADRGFPALPRHRNSC